MLNIFIKLLVSKLNNLFVLVALTGFVCTYKIQAEEECLSSNVLCYECDSRYDPDCADPFELSSLSLREQQSLDAARANNLSTHHHRPDGGHDDDTLPPDHALTRQGQETNSPVNISGLMRPKKMPHVVVCHGCCVKMTSKTPDGTTYFKRTCTTNLQINYFMVGLVCMKESGDRGKMCFCETDYCNGQPGIHKRLNSATLSILGICVLISLLVATIHTRDLS